MHTCSSILVLLLVWLVEVVSYLHVIASVVVIEQLTVCFQLFEYWVVSLMHAFTHFVKHKQIMVWLLAHSLSINICVWQNSNIQKETGSTGPSFVFPFIPQIEITHAIVAPHPTVQKKCLSLKNAFITALIRSSTWPLSAKLCGIISDWPIDLHWPSCTVVGLVPGTEDNLHPCPKYHWE